MTTARAKRPIAEIRIGKRHRRDLGDVDALATSIAELGLLQPVVITPDGALVAGERRLEACKALGWRDVETHTVDIDAIVRGEFGGKHLSQGFHAERDGRHRRHGRKSASVNWRRRGK